MFFLNLKFEWTISLCLEPLLILLWSLSFHRQHHWSWQLPHRNRQPVGVSIVMGVPQNGWFIRENPVKMDDEQGSPLFVGNLQVTFCKFLSAKFCRAFLPWFTGEIHIFHRNVRPWSASSQVPWIRRFFYHSNCPTYNEVVELLESNKGFFWLSWRRLTYNATMPRWSNKPSLSNWPAYCGPIFPRDPRKFRCPCRCHYQWLVVLFNVRTQRREILGRFFGHFEVCRCSVAWDLISTSRHLKWGFS